MTRVLFAALPDRWQQYEPHLRAAFSAAGLEVELGCDFEPESVDYIVYSPNSDVQDFTPYTRLKAVLNIWAGVENVAPNPTLKVPLARMVDEGLTEGMVEWVTGHVLRHHLGIDACLAASAAGRWEKRVPPLARNRPVGILGLGKLGTACGQALSALNFPVSGWSRSEKSIPEIACHHGPAGFETVLRNSEIFVLLLPYTAATDSIVDADALALMPKGAVLINPGRGGLVDDDALLAVLDDGRLAHATLDVFREEPLPEDHPFWSHPKVTVTPHVASDTRPETASRAIAENVRRGEAGEPFLHLVDRDAGY